MTTTEQTVEPIQFKERGNNKLPIRPNPARKNCDPAPISTSRLFAKMVSPEGNLTAVGLHIVSKEPVSVAGI